MRIAFGGIHTECSTYSRIRSSALDFRVLRGEELRQARDFQFLNRYSHEFAPTLHARAVPGGPVTRDAYDSFKNEFLERLRALLPVEGVYLAMHGAMFVEGMYDAEGDWIQATRRMVGESCLITASYDLHGNLSRRVVENLDMVSAYRTAPHIDVEETGIRACNLLISCLENKTRPTMVWAPIPVLMPGEKSSTQDEPAKRLYAQLERIDQLPGVLDASLLVGYVWADEPRSTASAVLTGTDKNALVISARKLAQSYWDARKEFNFGAVRTGSISQCLRWAAEANTQPVILADSGDNPTGGGVGDRAELLECLLEQRFHNSLVAGIADLPAVDACYAAGVGTTVRISIGATLDPQGSTPIKTEAKVKFLLNADDNQQRQAVVDLKGITVVLTAKRRPFHDIDDFTRLGLSVPGYKLLVVKSGYLSPDLAPLAHPNLMALSDGAINQDIKGLPSNRFRVPTFPFEPDLEWKPQVFECRRGS